MPAFLIIAFFELTVKVWVNCLAGSTGYLRAVYLAAKMVELTAELMADLRAVQLVERKADLTAVYWVVK